MNKLDYVIACPYCKRQYRMKLDLEEITLKKTRATCGRCGNSFELAPRIHAAEVAVAPQAASSSSVDIDMRDVLSSIPARSDGEATVPPVPAPHAEDVKATQFIPAMPAPPAPLAAPTPVAPPRTWQDLADPGLSNLREEPTLALLALEPLL